MSRGDKKQLKQDLNIVTDLAKEREVEEYYRSSLRIEPGAIDLEETNQRLIRRLAEEEEDEIDLCFEKEYKNPNFTLHKVMNGEVDKIFGKTSALSNTVSGSSRITIPQVKKYKINI